MDNEILSQQDKVLDEKIEQFAKEHNVEYKALSVLVGYARWIGKQETLRDTISLLNEKL